MTEIITVASYKGGNEKTQLIIEMVKELKAQGKKILAIDTDTQNCLFQWAEKVYGFTTENVVVEVDDKLTVVKWIQAELEKLTQFNIDDYDYILIDTAPDTATFGNKAIEKADKVIIPVEKSNPSTIAPLKKYVDKVKELCDEIDIVAYESKNNFIDDEILNRSNVNVLNNEIVWDKLIESIPLVTEDKKLIELEFEVENFEERKDNIFKSYQNVINEIVMND